MRFKQKLAAVLTILLILLHSFPVLAVAVEGQEEVETTTIAPDSDIPSVLADKPVFTAEIVTDGEAPGVYGTISYIPENALDINVEYSYGGESYYFVENGGWELDQLSPSSSPLTQLCMKLDQRPFTVWQKETVNNLYIRLSISCSDSDDIRTEPVLFSNNKTYPIPETPPPFTAEILYSHGGYQVNGHFEDFPPDVVRVRPMYSLDGNEYKTVDELYSNDWVLENLGWEDEGEQNLLQNQCSITYEEEPLKSYVAGKLERFYIRLEITTESGVYQTQAATIEPGISLPLPDNMSVKASVPFTMNPLDEWGGLIDVPYGQYQITVRESTPIEKVYTMLPDTLPVEVQIFKDNSSEQFTSGIVQCKVVWKELSSIKLTAGQSLTISDAVNELIVPRGTEVTTPLGHYFLTEPLTFDGSHDSGEVRLVIDVIGADEAPDVSLRENSWENTTDDIGALSLAFRLKPSGATSIKAYFFVEGDEDWTEICDLLSRRDLNHNQAMGIYGFVTLLQPEDSPFQDYLKAGTPFSIGLKIVGGTYDGEKVILPWPGDYKPPAGIPEPGGSEGNENNVGSGEDEGGGNSGDNGGQRPNLPKEEKPVVSNPSTDPVEWPTDPIDPPDKSNGNQMSILPSNIGNTVSTNQSIKLVLPSVNVSLDQQENTLIDQKESDNKEQITSNSTKPKEEKIAKISSWNEVQPQVKASDQGDKRPISDAQRTKSFPVVVTVLLLGSAIMAVAGTAVSAASGLVGTGATAKLLTILKKFIKYS